MRLAILSYYSGFVSRGVESFVKELTFQLKSKIKLQLYQADPNLRPSQPKPSQPNLLSFFYLDHHSLLIKRFTNRILTQLADNPPDILMALNNGWMSLLAKRFCTQHPTKLVLLGFAGIGWEDKLNLKINPDVFIACSKYQADWARGINKQAKIKTIYAGVNTDRFKPQGKKFQHGLTHPVILSIAGPQTYKRIELAIKAVAQLRNTSLLVVGQQLPKINQLGEKLLGSKYKNITVNYQDMDSVYRSADLFTLPSEACEAYGISILEAMASNLPVIVNRDPIRQELVGQIDVTLDPTDLSIYSQAIKTALSKDHGNQPRQQALKFSWPIIAQQYLQLFKSLCH